MSIGEITYIDGQSMVDTITIIGQQVSGMTAGEAYTALNGATYGLGSGGNIVSFPIQIQKGGTPISTPALQAMQAWEYMKVQLGAAGITSLGAAGAAAYKWGQGVLLGDPALSGTLAGSGGLLTMSIPAAASLMAPIFGVSIGAGMYQSNPELWTKISQTLLPFCYKDTFTLPFVADITGQVYAEEAALLAFKALLDAEGIGGAESKTDGEYTIPVTTTAKYKNRNTELYAYISSGSALFARTGSSGNAIQAYSKDPFELTYQFASGDDIKTVTYPAFYTEGEAGKSFYSRSVGAVTTEIIYPVIGDILGWQKTGEVVVYGQEIGGYPEGTSQWTGNSVDWNAANRVYPIDDPDTGASRPYFPVTLPIGDPTVTNNPAQQPDPTAPVEFPALDPYIPPETSPNQWPEFPNDWPEELPDPNPIPSQEIAPQSQLDLQYVPKPDLNPETDPSLEPDIQPVRPRPRPLPPNSTGFSPPTLFPPDPWPSIVPSTGSGLIHVYNPTPAEFINFGRWLWVTYADPSIQKLWNNPFDGVIGAHELYATPSIGGNDTIKSGFLDSGISSDVVTVRYTEINCGSLVIPEYYGNYLDYSPYCKAYAYLPFIGVVELEVDDIVGHAVNITYHIDSYNGSCIAQITVARDNYENTIYQFSGNCAVDLPLAGGSQSAIRAGMISAAAYGIGSTITGVMNGALFGGLTGAVVGGLSGAVSGVSNAVANVVSQKSSVQHSGSFGASYGAMGIKKPYIIIRRPVQKIVVGYNKDYGFPAHTKVILGECEGYVRVLEVNVQSSLATDEEKREIEQFLKSGVYVT